MHKRQLLHVLVVNVTFCIEKNVWVCKKIVKKTEICAKKTVVFSGIRAAKLITKISTPTVIQQCRLTLLKHFKATYLILGLIRIKDEQQSPILEGLQFEITDATRRHRALVSAIGEPVVPVLEPRIFRCDINR